MNQAAGRPEGAKIIKSILLVAGVILLPSLLTTVFGWMHCLLPLLVFYYIYKYGKSLGTKFIIHGSLLGLIAGYFSGTVISVFFALSLMPAGYAIAYSAHDKESPAVAGLKGLFATAICWFFIVMMIQTISGINPYGTLLTILDQGMDEALKYYRLNSSVPADTLYLLEQTLRQMKQLLPRLMPAILTSMLLVIVLLAMVTGNRLLQKEGQKPPWPAYRTWQLPEKLIWLVIVASVLAVLPSENGKIIGYNLILISGVIYCFQGIAIVLFFFEKWKVPPFVRLIFYFIIIFQSVGTIILSLLGLADVWFDMRRLKQTEVIDNKKNKNDS